MPELKFYAHYPFTDEAKEYAKKIKLQLTDDTLKMGEERIRQALEDGKIKLISSSIESELQSHLASYAASRLILAAWDSMYVRGRVAVCESKAANAYLNSKEDKQANYDSFLAKSFNISFFKENNHFKIPFYDYLMHCPKDIKYKLTNMELQNGLVKITESQKSRILEEAVRKKLEAPSKKLANPSPQIKKAIARLGKYLPREKLEPIKIEQKDFPPCIQKMINDLQNSQNVAHSGRLSLAIYLIRAGLKDEQIAAVFQKAPDYNKETTEYQIKHIRSKGYSMPACKTMDTYGLCIAKCRCNSPLHFRHALHGRFAQATIHKDGETDG